MTNNFVTFGQVALAVMATYFLHSTCLLGAVWLGLRLKRLQNMHVVEQLWKMAAIGGLFTAPLQVAIGGGNPIVDVALGKTSVAARSSQQKTFAGVSHADGRKTIVTHRPENRHPLADNSNRTAQDIPDRKLAVAHGPSRVENVRPVMNSKVYHDEPVAAGSTGPKAVAVLCTVVAIGLAWLAILRMVLQSFFFRRHLRSCHLLDVGVARESLDELLRRAGVSRVVRLESSVKFREPFACGTWRWRIVLPAGIETRLQAEELRALLAHEVAHLVRGDTAWLWIGRVLCCCFAFQPLNFLARQRWQRAAEFLCDNWAVRHDSDPLALANCLTRIAQWRLDRRDLVGALAATGDEAGVTRRIECLLATDRKRLIRPRTRATCAIACCTGLVLIFGGPRATWRGAHATEKPQNLTASDSRRAVATELELALSELEECQQLLSTADAPELQEMASRLRQRGAAIMMRHKKSLSHDAFVSHAH